MSIEFYTKIDRDTKTGKISSEYPAYTFPQQTELMQEEILKDERALEMGFVDPANRGEYVVRLERKKQRLRDIEDSKPKLTAGETDLCYKAFKNLREGIKKTLPSYDDEKRKFVRPHDEHRMNSRPCIKVTPEVIEIAQANGIPVSEKGEMSRKFATKLQTIIGRTIGEDTNIERLRKIK